MGKSYPMNGGDGPRSYTQNSSYQKAVVEEANRQIYEAITDKFDLKSLRDFQADNTVRIADLGCSTGPNTFIAVENITKALETKLPVHDKQLVEFQVLFNDHSDNDFNTLLRSLPPTRNYFAAAVPGSFHGRLFPRSSLHFVHSSTAVQWLSDVPRGVADKGSPAWNGGSVHSTGLVRPVQEAYSGQFRTDFLRFLDCRAEELVGGGWMAIALPGLPDGFASSHTAFGMYFDLLDPSLRDLARSGLIDAEKVDSFNMPLHVPSAKELAGLVMENGSFSIEKIEEMQHIKHIFSDAGTPAGAQLAAEGVAGGMRAVLEGLIRQHFGLEDDDDNVLNQLFQCYATRLADAYHSFLGPDVNILLLLRRN